MTTDEAWPALPLHEWKDTCDTLHMLSQIAGKVRLGLAPPEPEWAHAAMYVSPRGLTTGPIALRERTFQIDLDLVGHVFEISLSDGSRRAIALTQGTPVRDYYRDVAQALRDLRIDVHIWPMPVEVADPIRFDEDTVHASYDPQYANRFLRVLLQIDAAMKNYRAPFRGRHTRVQFFFGSFDLAYARFSGRPATPPRDDVITKEAMDAEEICVGFWPGDARFAEPAFWCYAFPAPPGCESLRIAPEAAFWNKDLGEFIMRYEDVRTAADPCMALHRFFTSTFEGLSTLAKW